MAHIADAVLQRITYLNTETLISRRLIATSLSTVPHDISPSKKQHYEGIHMPRRLVELPLAIHPVVNKWTKASIQGTA